MRSSTFRSSLLIGLLTALGCNCSSGDANTVRPATPSATAAPDGKSAGAETPAVPEGKSLPAVPAADPREKVIARLVGDLLQSQHLDAHPIDDDVSQRACKRFIERLDPGKMFLFAWQVETLMQRSTTLDDQMAEGDLEVARLGHALLSQQRALVAGIVAKLLDKPFDFTVEETLQTDADKREYPQDEAALTDLWRRNLKMQVMERVASMQAASEALQEAKEKEAQEAQQGEASGKDKGKGKDKDEGKTAQAAKPEDADEVADEILPETDEGREKKAREDLATRYAGRFKRLATPKPLEAVETFVNAITAVYDPHTQYLAPDDKDNFDIQMSGSLEGIGAVLSEDDHYVEVREVIPGGAAWQQGELKAGDLIMAVQQAEGDAVDVADMRLSEVVKLIRGPKGTVVTLTVRQTDDRVRNIEITRDVVVVEASYARGALLDLGDDFDPVGYVYLPSFYGNTRASAGQTPERAAVDDVRALLERFRKRKVSSVLLDLRGNGGGLLTAAKEITGLFIKQGPVVQAGGRTGRRQVLRDLDPSIAFDGQLVVLVDRFSASASEILAGALQDYGRAVVVGTGPTHGKGTVQTLLGLDRMANNRGAPLGVLKLTVQQYFLVDGESTQLRGVQPDVELPDPASYVESNERHLDNAIPWSSVEALPHQPWPGPKVDLGRLATASAKRQADNQVFATIVARGAHFEMKREETLVPLQLTAWKARRQADEVALEKLDPKLDEQPAQFSVEAVEYRESPLRGDDRADEAAEERLQEWRDGLSHDPWLTETLHIMHDMRSPNAAQPAAQ